ncbi:hypothetical protein ACJMK2_034414 [Sinanodonta woodiana]|uniref:Uncharacterized protein n=1 Tax=Sinanodonta woodiana TaxID=1069815 RepID=A0ABD3WVL3_SINWO
MIVDSEQIPRVRLGQGKAATTLLTEDGCYYPVISHLSYSDRQRAQSAPHRVGGGTRPMHRTTLTLAKPPWTSTQGYTTTNKQYFSGSKLLSPVRRPPLCPSMHVSQIRFGSKNEEDPKWNTNYTETYVEKEIIPANRLHLTSFVHRIDQTEGADMKKVVKMDDRSTNYWSQYNRIHSKLGFMLGQGVPREPPVRQSYNVLTGEPMGPAWRENNRRVSGNRVLNGIRREVTSILG